VIKMYESGMSTYQIGGLINEKPNKVWLALKKAGVKTRSKKEALEKYAKRDVCVVCGETFRVRVDWLHGNHYRKTCSPDCEKQYRSKRIKDTYTQERKDRLSLLLTGREITWHIPRGAERPNWKNGRSSKTYQRIAFKEYGFERICSICGAVENICVHHKDENRSNNTKENLQIVCKPCHASLHSKGNALWIKHLKR